jgi:hypothetical protein
MAMMMGNLCRALKQAGADDDSARKAAEEVATYVARIENRLSALTWVVGTSRPRWRSSASCFSPALEAKGEP